MSRAHTMGWFSRLVLGKRAVQENENAKRDFNEALNGHRFDPEQMREQLDRILIEAESKAQALSIPPPTKTKQERDEQRREHEPGDREAKAGAG